MHLPILGDPPEIRLHYTSALRKYNECVAVVQPPASDSPPDCRIFIFESPGKCKKRKTPMHLPLFGDPPGIRTPDPLLKRQLLCRLSYRVIHIYKTL